MAHKFISSKILWFVCNIQTEKVDVTEVLIVHYEDTTLWILISLAVNHILNFVYIFMPYSNPNV